MPKVPVIAQNITELPDVPTNDPDVVKQGALGAKPAKSRTRQLETAL